MRRAYPIFRATRDTPPPCEGVVIAKPLVWREQSLWLCGRLTIASLDPESARGEPGREWSRSLVVTAITQTDQVPQIACLGGDRAVYRAPQWQPTHIAGLLSLPFCVDLAAAFRYPLARERLYVHVSAREHCTEIVVVEPEPGAPLRREDEPIDSLLVAYSLARAGDHREAANAFARAFADETLRREVDGGHLYDAACCLARCPDPSWQTRALTWLREDLERRCTAHTRAVADWLTAGEDAVERRRRELDRALREHVDLLERDDDLASIRGQLDVAELLGSLTSTS